MKKLVLLFAVVLGVSFASCDKKAANTEVNADTTAVENVDSTAADTTVADTTVADTTAVDTTKA